MSNLKEKVAAYKLIARDALRAKLISPRLTRITGYENDIVDINAEKTKVEHKIEVLNYEISVLDKNHPDYAKTLKDDQDYVKTVVDSLPAYDKQVEEVTAKIKDQNDAIDKITSGETKVSLDELNDLVNDMVKKDALNQVATATA